MDCLMTRQTTIHHYTDLHGFLFVCVCVCEKNKMKMKKQIKSKVITHWISARFSVIKID